MLLPFDVLAARQRHEDMLREAENIRLARRATQTNGTPTLLSRTLLGRTVGRMVNLLSRSKRPAQGHLEATLTQPHLANAKGR